MELYNFIILAFKWLDQAGQNYSGFNNLFLIKFCQIVGIAPYTKFDAQSTIDQQYMGFNKNSNKFDASYKLLNNLCSVVTNAQNDKTEEYIIELKRF